METQCNQAALAFHQVGQRQVVGRFDGGKVTSDAGALLLRELELKLGLARRFAACFTDHRDADRIDHTVEELVAQRVFALALGYEDLNDHDQLRSDPLLALVVGKEDPTGESRPRQRDQGKPLAGKSTLNRLELTPVGATEEARYKKIVAHCGQLEEFFVEAFLRLHPQGPPAPIVLDLDATDDPLHGDQLGKFFHGYYKCYCYLPLYIFCGGHLLCAKLRPADIDASAGALWQVQRLVGRLRQAWPQASIMLRGDSGFCREPLMRWCEANGVDYVFGLAKNPRLTQEIAAELQEAKRLCEADPERRPARLYKDFTYQTLTSWSRPRRVIGKAEHLPKGANPRFVVTTLAAEQCTARVVYEQQYCGRGDMENRIKEQQLALFADRTSAGTMRANQLRLWFSSLAYVLLHALRTLALADTELEKAQCDTLRRKLFKIGAVVRVTVRKVWIAFSESYPLQALFAHVHQRLIALTPLPRGSPT